MAEPEDASGGWSGEGTTPSDPAVGGVETRRALMGFGGGERHPDAGRQLAVSTMVPRLEAVEESVSPATLDATAAKTSPVSGGTASVEQPRSAVSQPEIHQHHSTMVAPDVAPRLRRLVPSSGLVPEHSMVPPRDECQAAQHVPLEASPAASGHTECPPQQTVEGAREGQELSEDQERMTFARRQGLRNLLLALQLDNTGTTCYANSAFLAYMWACLSRKNFQCLDWGARSATLLAILHDNDGTPFLLDAQEWFAPLLHGWNEQQGQADSAEFGHRLADWLATDALSNSWERRVTTHDTTVVHDQGHRTMPLTLQLDPALIADDEISLSALLRSWNAELGMCAGLIDPRDLLVLHVERMVMAPSGRLYKHAAGITFAWEVQVPVLTSDTAFKYVSYTIVAVVAHLGGSNGGHYQTMLRTYPEVSDLAAPSMWMFCDDCRLPTRCWTFPRNFSQGITGFWLCKTDALEMHLMEQPRPEQPDALLTVLRAQISLPET